MSDALCRSTDPPLRWQPRRRVGGVGGAGERWRLALGLCWTLRRSAVELVLADVNLG